MALPDRYLKAIALEDLAEKMVFLGGPRQVGKTYLAKHLAPAPEFSYFNWDSGEDRKKILDGEWDGSRELVILDELHKYPKWKSFIKGHYDKYGDHFKFLVTGSARLDVYRRGGDSLQGRYHHLRLHPFSVREVCGPAHRTLEIFKPGEELPVTASNAGGLAHAHEALSDLLARGGFPEPLKAQSERTIRRWQLERQERYLREDIRELEQLRDLSGIERLCWLITDRAAGLLSLNSLREDLDVSHRAVTHWTEILERTYFIYRIRPYGKGPTALKKEAKVYLWDWRLVSNAAARLENLVASHLLKFVHLLQDWGGYRTELHFIRDKQKREVDFLVTCDQKPWFAVEVKASDTAASPALAYYRERLRIPWCYQVVGDAAGSDYDRMVDRGLRVMSAAKFLRALV